MHKLIAFPEGVWIKSVDTKLHCNYFSANGLMSQTDDSFLAAALRETHEEVGIPASRITMLGPLSAMPPERSLGGLHVWTYAVSYIYGILATWSYPLPLIQSNSFP
jgi:8-oxo-dGTP pyrophosphatase MutT (NUDIX family)